MGNCKLIIKDFFNSLCKNEKEVGDFFSYLDTYDIHYAILGGAVRAALEPDYKLRDIDIICDCDEIFIEKFFSDKCVSVQKNYFGGYKFKLSSILFDLWFLSDHYMFKENIYKESFCNIYRTTFINYDSICYDLKKNILYNKYYNKFLDSNVLDLIGNNKAVHCNPNPAFSICKLFLLKYKCEYKFSDSVDGYIKDFISHNYEFDVEHIYDILKESYIRHYREDLGTEFSLFLKEQVKDYIKSMNLLIKAN